MHPQPGTKTFDDLCLRVLCVEQEGFVALACLVDIRLARCLPGGMHAQDSYTAVDDIHIVFCRDIGDGSAAACIDLAELGGLECDAVVHLRDSRYGLVEVKLGGDNLIDEGATSLRKLS